MDSISFGDDRQFGEGQEMATTVSKMTKEWAGESSPWGLAAWVFLAVLFASGPVPDSVAQERALDRHVYRQGHMGMEVRLVLYAPSEAKSKQAARTAFSKVAFLDSVLSSYRSDSELARVNRQAAEGPVSVGYHLFTILEHAQRFARRSQGALDVTTGPLIELWREARRTKELPDSSVLRQAKYLTGWQHLSLNDEAQTVSFARDGMQINFGGVAKGYIMDQALEVLVEQGVSRALVEAGGDLVVGASPPEKEGWTIDIPHEVSGEASGTISVTHSAVATSGDAVQYVEIDGTRYSHVIDPRTGLGLTDQPTSTVVARRGIVSDGLATAVGILGWGDAEALVESYYPCTTVYVTAADSTRVLPQ